MDRDYAVDRTKKPQLIFRLRTRACIVSRLANAYLKTGQEVRLLDIGSADGRTLIELSNLMGPGLYEGVEYSRELIDQAPPLPRNVRLLEGDATALPESLSCGPYDIVTALALLEHLEEPRLALAEAVRVLKPGGLLIATCPSPFWDKVSGSLGLHRDEFHARELGKKEMQELLLSTGFELVRYGRFMWAPVSFLPYLRIPVNPSLSLSVDSLVSGLKLFDWLFVNQYIVGRKKTDGRSFILTGQ